MSNVKKNVMQRRHIVELLCLATSETWVIKKEIDFVIGRSSASDIKIQRKYISRCHSIITYENDTYKIYDNNTHLGTHINSVLLPKGKKNAQQLNEGDVICYGELGRLAHFYKFQFQIPKYKSNVYKANIFSPNIGIQDNQSTDIILSMLTLTNNATREIKIKIPQIEKKFMEDITNIMNYNAIKCTICNDIMIKAVITNCSHSFCEFCIEKWINTNKICPICNTLISKTFRVTSIDSFITDICNYVGGEFKIRRDKCLSERDLKATKNILRNVVETPRKVANSENMDDDVRL